MKNTLRKAAGVRIADKTARKAVREEGPLLRARRRRRRRFCMGRAGKSPSPDLPARDFGARRTRWPSRRPTSPDSGRAARSPACRPRSTPAATRSSPARYQGPRAWRRSPGMPAGLEGGPDGGDAPPPHSDMGRQHRMPAYRLALERTGIAQVHVPQRKPPRQREGRELLLDGQDRALLRLGGTAPTSSRGIRRSISTGIATCASRGAWTEAARSSAGSAGPLDSLLLPFRKRGPLHIWGSVQFAALQYYSSSSTSK